jgi:hypothetical protein
MAKEYEDFHIGGHTNFKINHENCMLFFVYQDKWKVYNFQLSEIDIFCRPSVLEGIWKAGNLYIVLQCHSKLLL